MLENSLKYFSRSSSTVRSHWAITSPTTSYKRFTISQSQRESGTGTQAKRPWPTVHTPPSFTPPKTYDDAVTVIRQCMNKFNVDSAVLDDDDLESGAGVGATGSFSKVTYKQVAPLVGLKGNKALQDIGTFHLHRSRIPTILFKSIVTDMDLMLIQYGSPPEHLKEEARSRFLSPIFNHLVTQFTFMLRNDPETIIQGCIGTEGRIEYYFRTFGATAILFVEIKLKVRNDKERLKAIAQVIAEGDGCDLANQSEGYLLPIHCIFCDGLSFEFFKFERNSNPSFIRGCFPGDPIHLQRGLEILPFWSMETSLPFILQFRSICETIFDVMLSAYIAGLTAYYNNSKDEGEKQGLNGLSLDRWDQALQLAHQAQESFREAEDQRKDGEIGSADLTTGKALAALQRSTGAVPTMYKSNLIMKGWDEDEVRKA